MEVVLQLLEVRGMQVAVHLPHVRERGAVDGVPWREVVVLRARERARVQRRERDRGDVILPRVRASGLRGDDRVSRRGKGCMHHLTGRRREEGHAYAGHHLRLAGEL